LTSIKKEPRTEEPRSKEEIQRSQISKKEYKNLKSQRVSVNLRPFEIFWLEISLVLGFLVLGSFINVS